MNPREIFIHIHRGCFAGTGAIVRLPQCQWSKPDGYGKISQCITTTKHSKAKTVCIFLGIYCMGLELYLNVDMWHWRIRFSPYVKPQTMASCCHGLNVAANSPSATWIFHTPAQSMHTHKIISSITTLYMLGYLLWIRVIVCISYLDVCRCMCLYILSAASSISLFVHWFCLFNTLMSDEYDWA